MSVRRGASAVVSLHVREDVPRCQHVKDAVEVDADGSVVRWIAATAVAPIDHAADPGLDVGGGERRGAKGLAGCLCGGDFAQGQWSVVAKVCDARLETGI